MKAEFAFAERGGDRPSRLLQERTSRHALARCCRVAGAECVCSLIPPFCGPPCGEGRCECNEHRGGDLQKQSQVLDCFDSSAPTRHISLRLMYHPPRAFRGGGIRTHLPASRGTNRTRDGPETFTAPKRGRGECRAPDAPATSYANEKSARVLVTTSRQDRRAFPHANGFNGLWRAIPDECGAQ